jgi:hypothetical protein
VLVEPERQDDLEAVPAGGSPRNRHQYLVGYVPRTRRRYLPSPRPLVIPGYFKMRSRFLDYAGSYVIHCHILAHEDRGMMVQVNVGPDAANAHMQHH